MKSEVKNKRLAILFLLCLVWSACGVAENELYETEDSANEMTVESEDTADDVLYEPDIEQIADEVLYESDIEQVAELLNHDLLSTSYLTSAYWVEEMIAAFPEVEAAKDQLETQHAAFAFLYEQMDAPYKINDIFHMEGNQYLFEYKSGGSNGAISLCLTEYAEGSNRGRSVFHSRIK